MPVQALQCKECESTYPLDARYVCEQCFGPYEVEYDYAKMKGKVTRESIGREERFTSRNVPRISAARSAG